MANSIGLAKVYVPLLDEAFKVNSKTAIFDNTMFVREGMNAGEVLLPKMSLQGLGNYSRSTGFVAGDATLSWVSYSLANDRGRQFQVDNMDNVETVEVAFGQLAGQFIKQKVVPEVDAIRIAKLASKAGNSATPATLLKSTVAAAINTGSKVMDDAEVPMEQRVLLVTPEVNQYIMESDLYVRNTDLTTIGSIDMRVNSYNGMPIVVVPQARMYTALTLYDGTTGGQEAGSYIKNASTGKDINFLIVHVPSVLGVTKHVTPRIFDPETNQSMDAWRFQYRIYHDLIVPDNAVNAIYLHNKP